jgi:TolA-binding protein
MKAQQRHQLKQNQFAVVMARTMNAIAENRERVVIGLVAVALVAAVAAGYLYWRNRTENHASAAFGQAMAITQSPIVPAPTVPGATQAPGTYPTEQARADAALAAFREVIDHYPSTTAADGARYHIASLLLALGRLPEAEAAFRESIDGGEGTVYGPVSHLGLAEAQIDQGKYDEGIRILNDLVGQRDGDLPVDAILMRLGRASQKAGRPQDARAFFRRVIDEFPESRYLAEARQNQ